MAGQGHVRAAEIVIDDLSHFFQQSVVSVQSSVILSICALIEQRGSPTYLAREQHG